MENKYLLAALGNYWTAIKDKMFIVTVLLIAGPGVFIAFYASMKLFYLYRHIYIFSLINQLADLSYYDQLSIKKIAPLFYRHFLIIIFCFIPVYIMKIKWDWKPYQWWKY